MKPLADKSVVVTGAGSGVGRASAELFAQHGARVVCATSAPNGRRRRCAGYR